MMYCIISPRELKPIQIFVSHAFTVTFWWCDLPHIITIEQYLIVCTLGRGSCANQWRIDDNQEFHIGSIFNTLRFIIDLLKKLRLVLELLTTLAPHDHDFKDAIFILVNLDQSNFMTLTWTQT